MTAELWTTLLRESSKRCAASHAACIVLGDTDVGKSTLLGKITSNSTHESTSGKETSNGQFGTNHKVKDVFSYGYLDVEEGFLDSSSTSRVNFWGISNATFGGCIETVVRPRIGDRIVYLIGVDASHSESCVESLKRWLVVVRQCANQLGTGEQKGAVPWTDLGKVVPVIIAVTKSDLVKIDDAMSMKRAKEMQGQLREIGLVVGASVVYISTTNDTNIVGLKKHILNRLYPDVHSWITDSAIEVRNYERKRMDMCVEDGGRMQWMVSLVAPADCFSISLAFFPSPV